MHLNWLKVLSLPRGVRVNEFSSCEELDRVLGKPGLAIEYANNWINQALIERAKTALSDALAARFPRLKAEHARDHIARFRKHWPNPEQELQAIASELEPLTYSINKIRNVPPDRLLVDRARVIFANQRQDEWANTLRDESIEIGPFTSDHESNIMILAMGLKRYNEKQMEKVFV